MEKIIRSFICDTSYVMQLVFYNIKHSALKIVEQNHSVNAILGRLIREMNCRKREIRNLEN